MSKRLEFSQHESSSDSLGFLLWKTFHVWQRLLRAELADLGITQVQYALLATTSYLSEGSHSPSQQDLSQHTGMDKMMVSEVIRTLEKKGWIERQPNPQDGRAFCLSMTSEGKKLLKQAVPAVENGDDRFFSTCSKKDQVELQKILIQLSSEQR